MTIAPNENGRGPRRTAEQGDIVNWLPAWRGLPMRVLVAIGTAVTVAAVCLAGPASSQGVCAGTETWVAGSGFIQDDPAVTSVVGGGNTTVSVTVAAGKEICSLSGTDAPAGVWNVTAAPFEHTAPGGSTIVNFVVSVRDVTTTTTSTSTSSTSSTSSSSTTSTTASTTTTTAPSTPTTLPRGPGQGALAIRPEGGLESSTDSTSVRGLERVDVVAARNGAYQITTWNGSSWSEYRSLGAPAVGAFGAPTIVSWAPGRLDVFVWGGDGKLWQNFSTDGGAAWSGWFKPLGDQGDLASAPDASTRGAGRLDVWVTGTDNQVWQRFWDGSSWNDGWIGQGRPSAGIVGQPTATSWDAGRVDVFVRGSDNKLWQRTYEGSWGAWGQPVGASGDLDSSPGATSWEPGNLLVFVRGVDGRVYALPFGGVWGSWIRLAGSGDMIVGPPGASSRGSGRFDVFGRGTDNLAYQIWQ